MIQTLSQTVEFEPSIFFIVTLVAFIAGLVRGFAGFALSAVVMASLAAYIPPFQLIPVCFILEGLASIVMVRGGIRDAKMDIVWGLAVTSAIGAPIGLYITTSFDPEISKKIALCAILILTIAQLAKMRPAFLSTRPGLYASGLTAGIATGLASVGGMVVALYILASNIDVKRIRASMVMFLFLGLFTSSIYLFLYGLMNWVAIWRALLLTPAMLFGVILGSILFKPEFEKFYKTACRVLLICLCLSGLFKLLF